jgi:hypothetical protein
MAESVHYLCSIHPLMNLTPALRIIVQSSVYLMKGNVAARKDIGDL